MNNLPKLIHKILEKGYLLSLASVDEGGPWVSDVIYIEDDTFHLYFISRLEFRHSKAFDQNPKAAGAITAVEKPEGQSTGVQVEGTVTQVTNIPQDALARYTKKRGGTALWQLAPGEAWYRFTPAKFDVIYEPLFGFSKKSFTP